MLQSELPLETQSIEKESRGYEPQMAWQQAIGSLPQAWNTPEEKGGPLRAWDRGGELKNYQGSHKETLTRRGCEAVANGY